MKILVDNNLSPRIISLLAKKFANSKHVAELGLDVNTEDEQIWEYAITNDFSIMTKDNDFEAMSRLFGCPPKVIQLTCGNQPTLTVIQILNQNIETISDFLNDNENCLLYIS